MLGHISIIEDMMDKYDYKYMPNDRQELYFLFKWLFQEVILTLSSQLRNNDLCKFLNQQMLQRNQDLMYHLVKKYKVKDTDKQRQIDIVITIMQDDKDINFDALINQ